MLRISLGKHFAGQAEVAELFLCGFIFYNLFVNCGFCRPRRWITSYWGERLIFLGFAFDSKLKIVSEQPFHSDTQGKRRNKGVEIVNRKKEA